MKVNTRNNCLSKPMCCMARRYGVLRLLAITCLVFASLVFAVEAQTGDKSPWPHPHREQTSDPSSQVRLCVVVPHFKDEYWLSVGHGLQEEASRRQVALIIHESGGYHALERQVSLLETCIAQGVDAILLGAISAEADVLLAAVKHAAARVPVLALVNELQSPDLAGSIGVDWRQMGRVIGDFLAARHPGGARATTVGFVTGPADSGWSPLLESGLRAGLLGSSVEIVVTRHADTGLREQLREVETALSLQPGLDYLVGSAPAIEASMGLAARSDSGFPQMIATYISHSVRRGLQSGKVVAVPFDDPVLQGRLGVGAALYAISGGRLSALQGPEIELIQAVDAVDLPLSPAHLVLAIE